MKKILVILPVLVLLASCGAKLVTTNPTPEYPSTQSGSPAAKYCMAHGGTVSYEPGASGSIMDLVYCTLKDGKKVDAWKYMSDSTQVDTTGAIHTGPTATGTTSAILPSYTLDQVKQHSTRSDCWTAVDKSVYDLTPFFGTHPGGDDNLSQLCGVEGTALFKAQHGNNPQANERIKSLKIGALAS